MSAQEPVQPLLPGLSARGAHPIEFKKWGTRLEFKVDVPEGIVEGYAATWDRDLGGDRFEKGSFADVIAEEFPAGWVKIYREHDSAIGLPIELKEDDTGVFVVAKIQPGDTQDGDETLNLASRGVYDSFSVAWAPDRKEMRIATEAGQRTRVIGRVATLPHVGILPDPMNRAAGVTAVKAGADPRLDQVLQELSEIKQAMAAPQIKSFWDLGQGIEALAILEGVRQWGELTEEQAEQALELIGHLVAITEETKRHLPRPAGGVPAELAGLIGRMSDYANQPRN